MRSLSRALVVTSLLCCFVIQIPAQTVITVEWWRASEDDDYGTERIKSAGERNAKRH